MFGPQITFIGQAPPARSVSIPFERTRLHKWFEEVHIDSRNSIFTALVDKFPGYKNGAHLKPSPKSIKANHGRLANLLRELRPVVVVTLGVLATSEVLGYDQELSDVVGKSFYTDPFNLVGFPLRIIPLPHPSGANPWIHLNSGNFRKLKKALNLIRLELEQQHKGGMT
jgi:uracil-DNA glycosylase